MKFFKNFKKNEVIIYAIALMLVTAGYFNFTTNTDAVETYAEANNISDFANEYANIGDARLVSNNEVIEENKNSYNTNNEVAEENKNSDNTNTISENQTDNQEEKKVSDSENNGNNTESQEAVETNNSSSNDYFVSSKLERDKTFASMISTYTKILNDGSVSETEKSIAMKEITKINNNKNAISICENLILNKGFANCIIFVNQESVNIVVDLDGELSKDKVAKVQNIVSREFNCEINNIHISQKTP